MLSLRTARFQYTTEDLALAELENSSSEEDFSIRFWNFITLRERTLTNIEDVKDSTRGESGRNQRDVERSIQKFRRESDIDSSRHRNRDTSYGSRFRS